MTKVLAPVTARVEGYLPETALAGERISVVLQGVAISPMGPITAVELMVAEETTISPFQGFPRADRMFPPTPDLDPVNRLFCGFVVPWTGTAPVAGVLKFWLRFRVDDGRSLRDSKTLAGGQMTIRAPSIRYRRGVPATVAIAMATFNPTPRRFRAQLDSIRGQTLSDWHLVISDESTDEDSRTVIQNTVAGDKRISLIHGHRVGFVGNFERALRALNRGSQFFALCDQDDVWYPNKLHTLVRAIERSGRSLVYGGMRIIDDEQKTLDASFFSWRHRHGHTTEELLVANTVTGAACLGQMELLDYALPFPRYPGIFHDMWLALVASRSSGVTYVPRILQDYVQHQNNVLGQSSYADRFTAAMLGRQSKAMKEAARFIKASELGPEQLLAIGAEFAVTLSGIVASAIERALLETSLERRQLETAPLEAFTYVGILNMSTRLARVPRHDRTRVFMNIPPWLYNGTDLLSALLTGFKHTPVLRKIHRPANTLGVGK